MLEVLQIAQAGEHPRTYRQIANPRRLWWILPDDMLPLAKQPMRDDVPMTCQYRPEVSIKFTPTLQQYVFSFNRTGNDALDRKAFQGYRDTWNTTGKVRDNYNAITGEGDPLDLPTMECNIGIAGNVVSGSPTVSDGTYGIPRYTAVLKMDVISPTSLPQGISYRTHPWLIHHLIIVRSNTYGGFKVRNPFPHLGGRDGQPVYTPLISPVPLYIEMWKLRECPVGVVPNPYNPEWKV